MSLYQLENIVQRYNGQPVLNIQQWQIPAHAIVGLAGPNGCGKSTLLRLLGFIERPSRGEIRFDDRKADLYVGGLRSCVTLLPQHSYLLKRSVYQNIAYGLQLRNDRRDERRRVHQAMEWVGLDPDIFAQRPQYALSGGEARRVALAARLVLQPRVFLLDEPTTSVDAASAHMIKASILRARKEWNTTLIISSHDMEWLNDICDHTLHLFRGHVMSGGQPTIIFGPWETDGNGRVFKTVTDGERMIAAHPPNDLKNAVAAIDTGQLILHANKGLIPSTLCQLKGKLVRLSIEKASQKIGATVMAGSLSFHIRLRPEDATVVPLVPGCTVWIGYDPAGVKWMD